MSIKRTNDRKITNSKYDQSNPPNRRIHLWQKTMALILLICLSSTSLFAVPETTRGIVLSASEIGQDIRFGYMSSNVGASLGGWAINVLLFFKAKQPTSQLSRIEIVPGNITVRQGEPTNFTAFGFTANGRRVSGLRFEWTVDDTSRSLSPRNLPDGLFRAPRPGNFVVRATAQGFQAQVNIVVEENRPLMMLKRLQEGEARGDLDLVNRLRRLNRYSSNQISSKRDYRGTGNPNITSPEETIPADNETEKRGHGPNAADTGTEFKPPVASSKSRTMMRPSDEDGWSNNNWWMADDPGNQTGNPPGTSPDAGAGNGNFQFSAPVVSLPGRGIDVNLALNYNSRVWSKAGNLMSFDAERGFPAPGWNLGFGKMMFMGTGGGCMLIDADGTNRGYTGTISNYSSGGFSSTSFTGYTTDGKFTDYNCSVSTSNGVTTMWGSSSLSNGTRVSYNTYSTNGKQAFPTQISDPQGNYVNVTYRNNRGPQLQTVTDTLGRVITFNYDTLDRLISVDVPKMDNGGTRTAVRLHYRQIALNPGWAYPITGDTNNAYPYVVDAIYYPGTKTGYWFGSDPNAPDFATYYSSYGMLSKLVEQRGMNWSGTTGDQGTVTAGTMSKQVVYNYPLSPDYTLNDAPTYSTQTESWDGMDTSAAVTNYNINFNSSPRTITVTQPNGVKSKQYLYNASGLWNDGLIYRDDTLDASNALLSKSVVTWEQGSYSSPRPKQTDVTNEKGQVLSTTYTYGTSYNQLISQKTYDYGASPLTATPIKDTRSTYENNSAYTSRHIFNLVKTAEIYDGLNNRLSKTDYEYDNNAVINGTGNPNLKATPGVTMHYSTYDPFTSATMDGPNCIASHQEQEWCDDGSGYWYICYVTVCDQYEQVSVYDPNTIFRGNLTKTTIYSDAAAASGAISQTKQYDATGNLVAESASCCELKTNDFTVATQYAYPTTRSRGSSDPNSSLRNTTTGVFDFNTGLLKQSTDANGRTSSTTYNPDSLRATVTTSSTGAYSTSVYDDAAMTVTNETNEYGGALASRNVTYLNGIGKPKRQETRGANNIADILEIQYTNMGQEWKRSRPYRSGDAVLWTEVVYDLMGRTSQVIEPDGSMSKAFYNETTTPVGASGSPGETVKSVDAWGRERWTRKDALGRLVEVLEPKADGNGSFAVTGNLSTSYTYDTLGRLTLVDQGGQLRKFKYDSLGRMTRQKLAEQSATINDAGQYLGENASGANWSGAVSYDDRSNIIQRVDPRGVKINYSYQIAGVDDPLNRIQGMSYDLSGPLDTSKPISAAAPINYEYVTSGDRSRILKIRTSGLLTEDFSYDGEGRVNDYTQTVDSRTSYPWTTTYAYDTLDRVTDVRYPAQYGMAGNPRKLTQNTYDASGRLAGFKVNGQEDAGSFTYNASSQITSMKVGMIGINQVTENYTFDSQTGLLTNQQAIRNGSTLLDLSYDYNRNNSVGNTNVSWKTGTLTRIINNLDKNKHREYQFDALGRLTVAKGKAANQWTQTYVYDRFGNRTSVTAAGTAADGSTIPRDGMAGVSYSMASNRITTAGFEYDVAGNQTRALAEDGVTWLKFEYDAANRLQVVRKDDVNQTLVQAFQFGSNNARLIDYDALGTGRNTFSLNIGGRTMVEYTEYNQNIPTWAKSYVYIGDRQLSAITPNGSGGENTEYSHPDRLGTRLITNQAAGTNYEQVHLPFGTALNAESTGSTSKRFTSYERSAATGLDYAQNRTYDPKQGRFTQVDPIGMSAASLYNPQSLNLYNYVGNDPINRTDPTGLFWGAIGRFFKRLLRIIALVVIAVVLVVIAIVVPILVPGIIGLVVGWAALGIAALIAFKLGSELIGSIREWLNRCNAPDFAGLSQSRRDELAQRGVTAEQWDRLRNKQRLGYFNIVAAIASVGLSLIGWLVDWARGGIQQDRTFFIQGQGATNLQAQVRGSSIFSPDVFNGRSHPGYPDSHRQNSFFRSLQLSFSTDGTRFEADIDFFNPNRGFGAILLHGVEAFSHTLGRLFGGGSRTNPYNVAYRSSWECK